MLLCAYVVDMQTNGRQQTEDHTVLNVQSQISVLFANTATIHQRAYVQYLLHRSKAAGLFAAYDCNIT